MLKAILVEDEEIFLRYLKTVIDYEQYGISVVATAKNGLEALELCRKYPVDLALVDINMPLMDGLAFAEQAKQDFAPLEVILVTGHSEFEYARQALTLGVKHYLLKPFEPQELVAVIEGVAEDISRRKEESLKQFQHSQLAEQFYLHGLITGAYPLYRAQIDGLIVSASGTTFSAGQFVLLAADFQDEYFENTAHFDLWRYSIRNILEELFSAKGLSYLAFNGAKEDIVCLVLFSEQPPFLLPVLSELCQNIREHLRLAVATAIGGTFSQLQEAESQYFQVSKLLENRFWQPNQWIITAESQRQGQNHGHPIIDESLLGEGLKQGDIKQIQEYFTSFFQELLAFAISKEEVYGICVTLINLCLSHLSRIGLSPKEAYGEDFQPFITLRQQRQLGDCQSYVEDIYRGAISCVAGKKLRRSARLAQQAKTIIEEQYGNSELSTQFIARQLFVDSSYLRAVFKKECKNTITNYILQVRLDEAQRLLTQTGMKLSAVALQVGFSDGAYFSKCFKKYYGLSPSEFCTLNR